jgi:transposase
MREHERMSNKEIADAFGVSYATIYKLIGTAPKEGRRKPRREKAALPVAQEAKQQEPEACLVVEKPVLEIASILSDRTYRISQGLLVIASGEEEIGIQLREVGTMIRELEAIQRHAGEAQKAQNEAW